jgi:hypothetical protein
MNDSLENELMESPLDGKVDGMRKPPETPSCFLMER